MSFNVKLVWKNKHGELESRTYQCAYFEKAIVEPGSYSAQTRLLYRDVPRCDSNGQQVLDESGAPIIDREEYMGQLRPAGVYLDCYPNGPHLQLPRDGESIYITNGENGRNADACHWPLRPKVPMSAGGARLLERVDATGNPIGEGAS